MAELELEPEPEPAPGLGLGAAEREWEAELLSDELEEEGGRLWLKASSLGLKEGW